MTRSAEGIVTVAPAAGSSLLAQGEEGLWRATLPGGRELCWLSGGDVVSRMSDGGGATWRADGSTTVNGALSAFFTRPAS